MTTKIVRTVTVLVISLIVAACGGKQESVSTEKQVADITRPPQTVKEGPNKTDQETNPDETISYDEWRRRREAEVTDDTP